MATRTKLERTCDVWPAKTRGVEAWEIDIRRAKMDTAGRLIEPIPEDTPMLRVTKDLSPRALDRLLAFVERGLRGPGETAGPARKGPSGTEEILGPPCAAD